MTSLPSPGPLWNIQTKVRTDAAPTSRAAAIAAQPRAGTQAARILDEIVRSGSSGLTDEQIAAQTGLSLNKVRPRRGELRAKGYVRYSGTDRATALGQQARVWVAVRT
jgi:DNA-binding CsgD family transcriptional regulator